MTVAALCDVHGNLPSLEAVLADRAFARADLVVIGGDVVAAAIRASGYPDAEHLIEMCFVEPVEAASVARLFEDRAQSP